MSRWVTLNIEGLASEDVPDLFEGMYIFEEGDRLVVYEFKSAAGTKAKEELSRRLALAAFEAGADRVVACLCGDTADHVWTKEYLSGDGRMLVEGQSWQGDHSYRKDSAVVVDMESYLGYRPNLGGNWYHEHTDHEVECV